MICEKFLVLINRNKHAQTQQLLMDWCVFYAGISKLAVSIPTQHKQLQINDYETFHKNCRCVRNTHTNFFLN